MGSARFNEQGVRRCSDIGGNDFVVTVIIDNCTWGQIEKLLTMLKTDSADFLGRDLT